MQTAPRISIYRNHPASYIVLAERYHINNPLFSKLRMLPFIPWGSGSIFLAIVTSSNIYKIHMICL
jgi:hypothetical protein